jgi:hypothetical protein
VKFVPYQLLDGRPSLVVDGSPAAGTVLNVTHGYGAGRYAAGATRPRWRPGSRTRRPATPGGRRHRSAASFPDST